jgi:coproporphyrinogen III oxidase-like Fe-S oxidoreductase
VELAQTNPWKQDIDKLIQEGLAEIKGQNLCLTVQGLLVADAISEIFV